MTDRENIGETDDREDNIRLPNGASHSDEATHSDSASCSYVELSPRMREALIKQMSPAALSFVGDSVFELYVRMLVLEKGSRTADKLNRDKVKIVNAKAQAQLAIKLESMLTNEEHAVYRRGKNARQHSCAKNQSMADYHKASGLEALFGYLYLRGEDERIRTLLQAGLGDEQGSLRV